MFSRRLPHDLTPNRFTALREAIDDVTDLTVSNPTRCGIEYPADLLEPLSDPAGLAYGPHPAGLEEARAAVASEYARLGASVSPADVVLTASTSEAYGLLIKLVCDPGDRVAIPVPSYPLLEQLVRLEGVSPVEYPLRPEEDWQPGIVPEEIAPRLLLLVQPNNPTGSLVHLHCRERLLEGCARTGACVVADEVFLDYPIAPLEPPQTFAATPSDTLTFALGGISKSLGLPQLKLAWIVALGPAKLRAAALDRLRFINDHYLSAATPAQAALPRLIESAGGVRDSIRRRLSGNAGLIAELCAGRPELEFRPPEGGWSAVLRFPAVVDEEALVLRLLEHDAVAVYPGYFFGFRSPGTLLLSLLADPGDLRRGLDAIRTELARHL